MNTVERLTHLRWPLAPGVDLSETDPVRFIFNVPGGGSGPLDSGGRSSFLGWMFVLVRRLLAFGTAAVLFPAALSAQEFSRPPRASAPAGRPKIGLVLSGGGARGVAHVGVLKALEKLRIPIDCIAGTSMGSIVGGLYASGMSPEQIEAVFQTADWRYLLSDAPPRESQPLRSRQRDFDLNQNLSIGISTKGQPQLPAGLVAGRKLLVTLRELTLPVRAVTDFNRLPIPFRAVATDLETGEKVVLDRGSLPEAMRASMAVPGIFTPYRIGDHLLVDGGVSSNLPIETVKAMGADIVIAVDLRADLLTEVQLDSALAVTNQMLDIYIKHETDRQVQRLAPQDILVPLKLPGVSSAGFLTSAENVPAGYNGAMAQEGRLSALSQPETQFNAFLARQRLQRAPADVDITFVTVDAPSGPVREELKRTIPFKAGTHLEMSDLQKHLVGLEGLRGYEVTDFEVVEDGGKYGLKLKARKEAVGPNFLHVGADFSYGSPGPADANLIVDWRMTELNRLGGEWESLLSIGDLTRVRSEFYQPLEPSRRLFVAPAVLYSSDLIDARDADDHRRRFRLQNALAGVDLGVRLAQYGELRLGYTFGLSDVSRTIDVPSDDDRDSRRGEVHVIVAFDTLNRTGFPTAGWFGNAEVDVARQEFGSEDTYNRIRAEAFAPITFGENTLVPRVTAGGRLGGQALPYYDRFSLGGFLNLSGLTRDDLYDQNFGLAEMIYYRQIAQMPPGLGNGIYGGASLEAGGVWSRPGDVNRENLTLGGSAFLGADTILGPITLGVGVAEGGNTAVYLQLGPAFGRGRLERPQ